MKIEPEAPACVCACQGRRCGLGDDDLVGGAGDRSDAWPTLARAGSGIARLLKGTPQSMARASDLARS
jgi:hypothetical protein